MSDDEPMEQDFWEDTFAAKKLNGIYSNRIYAQPLGDGMVRINFGEILDDEPRYHTAIVATAAQVKAFAQLMFNVSQAVLEAEMNAQRIAAQNEEIARLLGESDSGPKG